MRLITRDELPGPRFWVKHPGDSRWYVGEYDQQNDHALVISVLDTVYSSLTVTAEQAAHEGYLWNSVQGDAGSRSFYVDESNDPELRKKLTDAGDKPFTLVLKSGSRLACTKSVPGIIPLIVSGLFDGHVTFEVIVGGKPRLVHWYDVENVLVD